jgi:hypothetical protein
VPDEISFTTFDTPGAWPAVTVVVSATALTVLDPIAAGMTNVPFPPTVGVEPSTVK